MGERGRVGVRQGRARGREARARARRRRSGKRAATRATAGVGAGAGTGSIPDSDSWSKPECSSGVLRSWGGEEAPSKGGRRAPCACVSRGRRGLGGSQVRAKRTCERTPLAGRVERRAAGVGLRSAIDGRAGGRAGMDLLCSPTASCSASATRPPDSARGEARPRRSPPKRRATMSSHPPRRSPRVPWPPRPAARRRRRGRGKRRSTQPAGRSWIPCARYDHGHTWHTIPGTACRGHAHAHARNKSGASQSRCQQPNRRWAEASRCARGRGGWARGAPPVAPARALPPRPS